MSDRTRSAEIHISGMDCPSCAVRLQRELAKIPGVESVEVDYDSSLARACYDPASVDMTAVRRAVQAAGFEAVDRDDSAAGQVAGRPYLPPVAVLVGLVLSLPVLIVFRDALPFTSGARGAVAPLVPGGLNLEDFDSVSFLAIGLAFVIGLAVFFTPAMIAMSSALVGYIAGSPNHSRLDSLKMSVGFTVGLVATNAAVGALFALGGKTAIRLFAENLSVWSLLLAVVLLAMGLLLLRIWTLNLPVAVPRIEGVRGFGGALMIGAPFGLMDCPACTPLLLPVALGAAATGNPLYGAALMAAFGLGRGVLLIAVGSSAGLLKQARGLSRYRPRLEAAAGVLLLLGGLYFLKEFIRLSTTLGF